MRRIARLIFRICVAATAVSALAAADAGPRGIMSLSYNPSGTDSEAQMQKGFSEADLRADLRRLAAHTGRIRTYSLEFGLDRVPALARELGLKVSLGIWLGSDRAKNRAEMAKIAQLVAGYPATIDRLFVGNETIVRGDLAAGDVIIYLREARRLLAGRNIPISTAEPWHIWLKHPELAVEVDFIGAHLLPFWDGVPAAAAASYLAHRFDELRTALPGKKIMIAETGWPSKGAPHQAATASVEAQASFVKQFMRQAADRGYDYNIAEAFDQPWKAPQEAGTFWGVLDNSGKAKFDF